MLRPKHTDRHVDPRPAGQEGEGKSATRVVFEGNDAVEKVAKLLSTPRAQAGRGTGLGTLARALTEGDLLGRLESRIRALRGKHDDQLAEMRRLEARDPDAFLAGALAGFALGRSELSADPDGDSASACDARPPLATTGSQDAGISRRPVDSAQTGPGGLGSLEAPDPDASDTD